MNYFSESSLLRRFTTSLSCSCKTVRVIETLVGDRLCVCVVRQIPGDRKSMRSYPAEVCFTDSRACDQGPRARGSRPKRLCRPREQILPLLREHGGLHVAARRTGSGNTPKLKPIRNMICKVHTLFSLCLRVKFAASAQAWGRVSSVAPFWRGRAAGAICRRTRCGQSDAGANCE